LSRYCQPSKQPSRDFCEKLYPACRMWSSVSRICRTGWQQRPICRGLATKTDLQGLATKTDLQNVQNVLATIHETLLNSMAGDSQWGRRSADGAEGDASAEKEIGADSEEQRHNYEKGMGSALRYNTTKEVPLLARQKNYQYTQTL
jgi:hypothetical protein